MKVTSHGDCKAAHDLDIHPATGGFRRVQGLIYSMNQLLRMPD